MNLFPHFVIQPIKCPVQNSEISTFSLYDAYPTTVSLIKKLSSWSLSKEGSYGAVFDRVEWRDICKYCYRG